MTLAQKWKEFVYSISTQDRYADFDSHQSFNRLNKPDENTLLGDADEEDDITSPTRQPNKNSLEGVHETRLAWRHIKNWLATNHPDLNGSLSSPATDSDIKGFQQDLNVKLPNCVIDSFKTHDGQELLNGAYGLVFGLELMSLDDVSAMTQNWRKVSEKVNDQILNKKLTSHLQENLSAPDSSHNNAYTLKKFNNSSLSLLTNSKDIVHTPQEKIPSTEKTMTGVQTSVPPDCVHPVYAHPLWIPVMTDRSGNHVAIDLCPAKEGIWGQVILFGRDFDIKYKIADNWGDFLLIFANDLEMGNYTITESEDLYSGDGDLSFKDSKTKKERNYLNVLKERTIEKWKKSQENHNDKGDLVEQLEQTLERERKENSSLDVLPKLKHHHEEYVNEQDIIEATSDTE